jgi:hypothetical protein
MTTPNAFTRCTLVGVAEHMTYALSDLAAVLPHMRAVAASATGNRGASAQRALAEAEALEERLRELDRAAESAKVLFRSATMVLGGADDQPPPTPHTCPPALLTLGHDGPATLPDGGAALVRRQV